MFNLITSYYNSHNDERQQELKECLTYNSQNDYIEKIYLLNDHIYDIDFIDNKYKTKIIQLVVNDKNKQKLYYDCAIQFANNYLFGQLCILSNADIYFDNTLQLLENYNFKNIAFALSRYDNNVLYQEIFSQDSWMFLSPLNVDISQLNFQFGVCGCDNRFARIIVDSGYYLINPSKTIKTHHLHNSNYRTCEEPESERIHGDYAYVFHTELNQ